MTKPHAPGLKPCRTAAIAADIEPMAATPLSPQAEPLSPGAAVGQADAAAGGSPRSPSLRKAVGQGFSWLTVSLFLGRLLGVAAQLLLGRLLAPEDFGLFAIVVAVSAVVRVFLDGGVAQVLVQRGSDEVRRLAGPGFWMSLTFGSAIGALLAVAAPGIAWVCGKPNLTPLLWIIAAAMPIGAAGAILRAQLRVGLRFRILAMITLGWFVIRHLGSVGLASMGIGAASLVLPVLLNYAFDLAASFWATRMKPWAERPQFRQWPALLGDSIWVAMAASFRGLTRMGDYFALGVMLPATTVGKYFFGYMVTAQIIEMLAANLQQVLFPVLSRLAGEPDRQARAIVRTTRMLVLIAAPLSIGLAIAIRPLITFLDAALWQGKWGEAIALMQIFAVAAPIRMFSEVFAAALASRGQFRESAGLLLLEGVWLVFAASIAAAIFPTDLGRLAAVVAAAQVMFSIVASSLLAAWHFAIGILPFVRAFAIPWLTSMAAAAAAFAVRDMSGLDASSMSSLLVTIPTFLVMFVMLAWLTLRSSIEELARLLPGRLGQLLERVVALDRPFLSSSDKR